MSKQSHQKQLEIADEDDDSPFSPCMRMNPNPKSAKTYERVVGSLRASFNRGGGKHQSKEEEAPSCCSETIFADSFACQCGSCNYLDDSAQTFSNSPPCAIEEEEYTTTTVFGQDFEVPLNDSEEDIEEKDILRSFEPAAATMTGLTQRRRRRRRSSYYSRTNVARLSQYKEEILMDYNFGSLEEREQRLRST